MSTAAVREVIARFHKMKRDDDDKANLVIEIEDLLPNRTGEQFLVELVRNRRENDMARIEAMKVLYLQDGLVRGYATALHQVLSDKRDDTLVRAWAAQKVPRAAMPRFAGLYRTIAADEDDFEIVRGNVIAGFDWLPPAAASVRCMRELSDDEEFGSLARFRLKEWGLSEP